MSRSLDLTSGDARASNAKQSGIYTTALRAPSLENTHTHYRIQPVLRDITLVIPTLISG
jgi:hypothetical protein